MIRWQLHLLWPLLALLLALGGFALYVFTSSERLYRLKLLLVPAVFAAIVFGSLWIGARLGYAAPAKLPAKFEYLHHKVILDERSRKTWIDILVVSRKPLERDARLHRVPWTQKMEDTLKLGREMKKSGGGDIEMHRGDGDEYPGWVPQRVLPQEALPKDPPAEQQPQEPDLLAPQGGSRI